MTTKSTSPKTSRRSSNTKTAKSNVAKKNIGRTGFLVNKPKFNWKIAAVVGVIIVAALGYLYVRLSSAAKEVLCTGPSMSTNCFYYAKSASRSGGQTISKTTGASSWTGTQNDSITFHDKVYGSITTDYCFDMKVTSKPGVTTKYTITWKNVTTNTSKSRSFSEGSTTQTLRCVGRSVVNGWSSILTNQEIKLSIEQGSVIVYRMIRYWNGSSVTSSSPTMPVTASSRPGTKPATSTTPSSSTTPGTKPSSTPSSTPTPVNTGLCGGTNTWQQGSSGDCVKLIQKRLSDLGYDPGPIDGIYGEKTYSAVKVFESKNGMTVDGIVDTRTWSMLFSADPVRKQ